MIESQSGSFIYTIIEEWSFFKNIYFIELIHFYEYLIRISGGKL